MAMGADNNYRLGRAVVPELYKLRVDTDMKRCIFSGSESIYAKVTESSDRIVMNSYMLKIKEAYVINRNSRIDAKPVTDDKIQRLTLLLDRKVIGSVEICIRFEGKAGERMAGLYRSSYKEKGKAVNILTTQFEALYARQAFPCFDEPELKAAFELTLSADKDYKLVSNMPAKSTVVKNGRKCSVFMRTPIMSTYLLYIGVLKHVSMSGKYRNVTVSAHATPAHKEYLKLPVEYTIKLLAFYERYFGIRYPLPKLDIIAVPDFSASAMENWGAITFREHTLLVKEDSPLPDKQYTAMVIAHELAHQWFGDLVTMRWWNDIWLNESFAEFMAYKATSEVFPEFNMDKEFLLETVNVGLDSDGIKSTHPVEAEVRDPTDMDRAFDHISYRKGGSILGMMEDYTGKEKFRKGLQRYLRKHMYSNSVRDDLWNAIDSVAGRKLQVKRVANAWITQKGYPYINVGGDFSMEQSRFILGMLHNKDRTVWPIPVIYATGSGKSLTTLFDRKRGSIKGVNGWIKLNYGQRGLYRVFYEKRELMKLGTLVKEGRLSWSDGWGMANDLFALARAGDIKVREYLDFADLFRDRCEYPMANSMIEHMLFMHDMLPEGDALRKRIESICIDYSGYHIRKLGWKPRRGENGIDAAMRSAAISAAGYAGDTETISKAIKLFSDFKTKGIEIDSDIRSSVFRIAARNGSAKLYDWFKNSYIKERDPAMKKEYMDCLGVFMDRKIITDALAFSMGSDVRDQDRYVISRYVSENQIGKTLIWSWTKKNWKNIIRRFEVGDHMVRKYIENLIVISDAATMKEMKSFFAKKENFRKDIVPVLNDTLERVEANIKFLKANK